MEISASAWRGVGGEEEWLACESGKSSTGGLQRVGAGELQGENKEAQSVREILCRLCSVPAIKVKTWRKEMSAFSDKFREVGALT